MAGERITNAVLYERLGAVAQSVAQQAADLRDHRGVLDDRWSQDQKRFANIEASVSSMKTTLDRIKGPIETAISLKSFLLGLAALVSALGVFVGMIHYGVLQRLVSLFHP